MYFNLYIALSITPFTVLYMEAFQNIKLTGLSSILNTLLENTSNFNGNSSSRVRIMYSGILNLDPLGS